MLILCRSQESRRFQLLGKPWKIIKIKEKSLFWFAMDHGFHNCSIARGNQEKQDDIDQQIIYIYHIWTTWQEKITVLAYQNYGWTSHAWDLNPVQIWLLNSLLASDAHTLGMRGKQLHIFELTCSHKWLGKLTGKLSLHKSEATWILGDRCTVKIRDPNSRSLRFAQRRFSSLRTPREWEIGQISCVWRAELEVKTGCVLTKNGACVPCVPYCPIQKKTLWNKQKCGSTDKRVDFGITHCWPSCQAHFVAMWYTKHTKSGAPGESITIFMGISTFPKWLVHCWVSHIKKHMMITSSH